jgi:hypothetical protein
MLTQTQLTFIALVILLVFIFALYIYYVFSETIDNNKYESSYLRRRELETDSLDQHAPELSRSSKTSRTSKTSERVGKKQVFNISNNIYTFDEAKAVCKVFNGELATLEQMIEAYRQGADWCNYGWVEGQMAFYPTQKETWLKLQKNSTAERRNQCGKAGLNGGYFNNPNLRFGVNCYGIKPSPRSHEVERKAFLTDADAELQNMVNKFKKEVDNITILPHTRDKWNAETSY